MFADFNASSCSIIIASFSCSLLTWCDNISVSSLLFLMASFNLDWRLLSSIFMSSVFWHLRSWITCSFCAISCSKLKTLPWSLPTCSCSINTCLSNSPWALESSCWSWATCWHCKFISIFSSLLDCNESFSSLHLCWSWTIVSFANKHFLHFIFPSLPFSG